MYNLCVSNICFDDENIEKYYSFLQLKGINNIEIAPTKLFGSWKINKNAKLCLEKYNIKIVSMQSLFYKKNFNCFRNNDLFIKHFKKIFNICNFLSCDYVVFGSPKNRLIDENMSNEEAYKIFNQTLERIKPYQKNIILAIELNPEYYGCNFFNKIENIQKIKYNDNVKFHFDTGCIEYLNKNFTNIFLQNKEIIKNIHVSQKNLKCFSEIDNLEEHIKFSNTLKNINFNGNVSLEMKSESYQKFEMAIDNFIKIYK